MSTYRSKFGHLGTSSLQITLKESISTKKNSRNLKSSFLIYFKNKGGVFYSQSKKRRLDYNFKLLHGLYWQQLFVTKISKNLDKVGQIYVHFNFLGAFLKKKTVTLFLELFGLFYFVLFFEKTENNISKKKTVSQ